ncbi:MAG: transcriptional regulator, Crp/Fnr family [Hyphomicrobiales bacterium]|nr:transcriptional regulator, Crp/Fnr family [Hyphomicrobiales bacterium]
MECERLTLYPPKALLMQEGSPAHHVFLIAAGTVSLSTLLPDGRRQVFGFARKGDFLGVVAEDRYACTAYAVDRVSAFRMDRIQMRETIACSPQLLAALQEITSCELAMARRHIVLLGRRSAVEKVAGFILEHQDHASDDAPAHRVDLPMTRLDIADYLGLTLETVCRTLTALARAGIIVVIPGGVRILDHAGMAEAAAGEDTPALEHARLCPSGARRIAAEGHAHGG